MVQPKAEPETAPTLSTMSVVDVKPQPLSVSPVPDVPKVESAPESEVTPMASNLLSAVGLAPSADGDAPGVPGESPLLLAGLAAFRRQTQQASTGDQASAKIAADPSQSSLMMAAAVANSAPTAAPVVGSPDQATGAVRVSLNATDPDSNPLTYSVTGQPTGGSVVALGGGEFTYTPTVASRLAAATTSTPDFDSFTVSVSDGQGGVTPVSITVPKLPAVLANQPSSSNVTGASPSGVAMVGDLAYVANQGSNTVTVINTKTGAVVGSPIVVGSAPTGILANADGSKVYVANRTSGTVSVIRTSDNTVIGSVQVGTNPEQMVINGTRLYVTNYGSSNVSVVDIGGSSPSLITNVAVGAYPRGIAVAMVNGQPRLYVTRYSSSSVAVIDANTNKQIDVNPSTKTVDSIKVGASPQSITVSPDGSRAYVTNYGSNSVSVINTVTNTVDGAAISVGSKPAGVALSSDGSLLYVANGNDTVSVINTKTRALVATMQIDSQPETNYHTLAVRSDGALIVTDMADKALRVVTYQRGNTAPVAIANPSVGATNPDDGAITGAVNIKDWDGDPLTYTTVSGPTRGTVSFNAVAGTYTYTPTQAGRNAAAQNPGLTDTFTIRATDPNGAYRDTTPITVAILPSGTNHAPVLQGDPTYVVDLDTGRVSGSFTVTDVDGDLLSYSYTEPAGGDVMVFGSSGPATSYNYNFIVNMSDEARQQAALTTGPDTYAFNVTLSDGTTWSNVPVSVPIEPRPADMPNWQEPSRNFNPTTGVTTGHLNVTDPDGDALSYSIASSGPWYGTMDLNATTGDFTYTPLYDESTGLSMELITIAISDGSYTIYRDMWVDTYGNIVAAG
jgi:YVTN family beta-propeller protein/VCBS repeat-containing protein